MNRRKRKWCCAATCGDNQGSFVYSFPVWKEAEEEKLRLLTWIQRSGCVDVYSLPPDVLSNNFYLCDRHFDDDQYVDRTKRKRLKWRAEPVLNRDLSFSSEQMHDYKLKFCIDLTGTPQNAVCTASAEQKKEQHDEPLDGYSSSVADGVCHVASSVHLQHDHNYISPVMCCESGSSTETASGTPQNAVCTASAEQKKEQHDESLDGYSSSVADGVCHVASSVHLQHDHNYISPVMCCESGSSTETASVSSTDTASEGSSCEMDETHVSYEVKQKNSQIHKKCSVSGCENNNVNFSMHSFPRCTRFENGSHVIDEFNLRICKEWVKVCGSQRLFKRQISQAHKFYYVCSAHFEMSDYLNFERKRLKPGVIPKLLLPTPLVEESNENINDVNVLHEHDTAGLHNRLHVPRNLGVNFNRKMKELEWHTCPTCQEKYLFRDGLNRTKIHRSAKSCWQFSEANLMNPGVVPDELKDLSFVEEQLVARIHPVLSVYKLKGCQYGYRGNVINFSQDVNSFAKELPHRISDLSNIITVRFENNRAVVTDFRVRGDKVYKALVWLKANNEYYKHIEISQDNLALLPEDGNVYDEILCLANEERTMSESDESDQSDIESENLVATGVPSSTITNQDLQIRSALNWPSLSSEPVSEFSPGFIMCAFPKLFPYGNCDLYADKRIKKISIHAYMKHFLCFYDDRFAQHKTFRFFAFNMWMRQCALTDGNVYVKKNANIGTMSPEELKKHIEENPGALKNLMFIGSNIRGSKPYWKKSCEELKDMVEQIGLPTVFLTMSAADFYWPELFKLLSEKDINDISMVERRRLVQDNPLIVDTFFKYRLECFIENVLEPHYNVVDYWYRIEYQHRGSPHVHGLFWFKDAPNVNDIQNCTLEQKEEIRKYYDKLISAVNPDLSCSQPEMHPCEVMFEDVVDEKTDLAQLLKTVQRHQRCTSNYCLRTNQKTKQTECRFHFPQELLNESVIRQKENSVDYEYLPERNDDLLNKFNPFIILSWRANIDIAPVLSKKAILEYIAKYVSKSEVRSQTLSEICNTVLASASKTDKAKKLIQRILIKNCVERDVSSQEVCHILMSYKLYSASGRDFVVLNTSVSSDWEPLQTNNEDRRTGRSLIEKYMERPENLESLTLWEAAKYYNCASWSKLRKKSNIVRVFPKFNVVKNAEQFYRQKVLLHSSWRRESDLKPISGEDILWEEIFTERRIVDGVSCELGDAPLIAAEDEMIVDHNNIENEDWMIASRLCQRGNMEKIDLGRREIDVQFDWQLGLKKYEQYGDIKYFENFLENEKRNCSNIGLAMDPLPDVVFSEDQECVRKLMEAQIKQYADSNNNEELPKRIVVQGKAGTGKSLLIKYLTANLQQAFGSSSYLLLGPTGVSAVNINGSTIHSGLHISRNKGNYCPLRGEKGRNFCSKMASVKFLIIDEYSMIGARIMGLIDKRCREGTGKLTEPFGGLNVYLFGDVRQLLPVKDDPLFKFPSNFNYHDADLNQHGINMFNTFEKYFVLKKCFRQSDSVFQKLLDNLSYGDVTDDDYDLLTQRFSTNVSLEEVKNFDNAIRLFAKKLSVRNFNLKKMEELRDADGNFVPIARIPSVNYGCGSNAEEAEGLEKTLYLAIGTKVMLKGNLWTEKGLVNGAIGNVVDLLYAEGQEPPNGRPAVVMVHFPGYKGNGIGPENLVPLTPILRSWSVNEEQCSRLQFPLVVCYAISIHKSQGLTLDKAIVDIEDTEFSLGLSYVGLSRVKDLGGLLLVPFHHRRVTHSIKIRSELKLRVEFEKRFNNI